MKKILFLGILSLFTFSGCSDYLDVNDEQSNNPYSDSLTPNAMLAGALNNYTNHQVGALATYGNRMAYVWGLNSGFTSSDPAFTYVFASNSYVAPFENSYLNADNFQDIIDLKTKLPNYEYHYGVAKIFKVMCFDYITALYGDAPYFQALDEKIAAPKYDDDKKIIPELFKELDEARAFLTTSNPDVISLGSEDIVFAGDVAEWEKFLNTVELKLLLRLTKTTDANLVALRTSRAALLDANKNFISSDVTVNPGYNGSALGQRSPLFRLYGRNELFTDFTSANLANAAGDYIAKVLNGTQTNSTLTANIVDPRRPRIFTLVGGQVVGNTQGIFPLTAISRFAGFYIGRSGAGGVGPNPADVNGMERDAFLMLAAESHFLQAEAFERGLLTGGSAATSFNDGVTASFNFYSKPFGSLTAVSLPPLVPATYLTAIAGKNGLDYGGSTDKINAIITQKYIALAQWNGIELYLDNMRTGYPVLPLPVGISETTRPNRLIYPNSEYSNNSSNVPNVTAAEIFTVNSKTPYYLQ
jgi:Starch-binding associating with outer membrane